MDTKHNLAFSTSLTEIDSVHANSTQCRVGHLATKLCALRDKVHNMV